MITFYEIKDRTGGVVAIHRRKDLPDGGKDLSWLRPDGMPGLNGTPTSALPLYGIHKLPEWAGTVPVVLTEGEKVAEALWSVGVPAVATVCGAAVRPEPAVLADLTGRAVICAPDHDEPGVAHMRYVADTLVDAAAVAWLEPAEDKPAKWDLADAVAAGEDVAELLRGAVAWPLPVPYRTLADIDETPPAPLLLGMLERDGSTTPTRSRSIASAIAPIPVRCAAGVKCVRKILEVERRSARQLGTTRGRCALSCVVTGAVTDVVGVLLLADEAERPSHRSNTACLTVVVPGLMLGPLRLIRWRSSSRCADPHDEDIVSAVRGRRPRCTRPKARIGPSVLPVWPVRNRPAPYHRQADSHDH